MVVACAGGCGGGGSERESCDHDDGGGCMCHLVSLTRSVYFQKRLLDI